MGKYISPHSLVQTHLYLKNSNKTFTTQNWLLLSATYPDICILFCSILFGSVSLFKKRGGGWDPLSWPSNESQPTVWKTLLLILLMAICWVPGALLPLWVGCCGCCFPVLARQAQATQEQDWLRVLGHSVRIWAPPAPRVASVPTCCQHSDRALGHLCSLRLSDSGLRSHGHHTLLPFSFLQLTFSGIYP